MIIHAVGGRHILEAAVVLELGPCVEIEALCQPIEIVVDRRKARFAHDGGAVVNQAREAAVDNQQIGAALEIGVRHAPVVQFLDVAQQRVEISAGIGERRVAQGGGVDIVEHQVAIAQQTVATRTTGEAAESAIDIEFATQHPALQPAVRAATGRDFYNQENSRRSGGGTYFPDLLAEHRKT